MRFVQVLAASENHLKQDIRQISQQTGQPVWAVCAQMSNCKLERKRGIDRKRKRKELNTNVS
jgi:hypothetical protein